jgi:hypothetical protein
MSAAPVEAPQAGADDLPQAGEPTPTTPPQAGKPSDLEGLTPAELAQIVRDLRKESGGYRTKLTKFEEAERERQQAQLSEVEKRDTRIRELETQVTAAQEKERAYALRDAIDGALGTKDFPHQIAAGFGIADVLKFLDASAIEWSESGQPANVRALLTGLVKSKPALFARPRVPSADGGAGQGGAVAPTMTSLIRQAAGRE